MCFIRKSKSKTRLGTAVPVGIFDPSFRPARPQDRVRGWEERRIRTGQLRRIRGLPVFFHPRQVSVADGVSGKGEKRVPHASWILGRHGGLMTNPLCRRSPCAVGAVNLSGLSASAAGTVFFYSWIFIRKTQTGYT